MKPKVEVEAISEREHVLKVDGEIIGVSKTRYDVHALVAIAMNRGSWRYPRKERNEGAVVGVCVCRIASRKCAMNWPR
jgi:hypothetical protein